MWFCPCAYRAGPAGRARRWTHLSLRDVRLPAVLRGDFAHPPGGARDRTGGRHGVEHGGAAGAGRLPAGRADEEDQSWATGKSVQTPQGGGAGKVAKDKRQPRAEEETFLIDLVRCDRLHPATHDPRARLLLRAYM